MDKNPQDGPTGEDVRGCLRKPKTAFNHSLSDPRTPSLHLPHHLVIMAFHLQKSALQKLALVTSLVGAGALSTLPADASVLVEPAVLRQREAPATEEVQHTAAPATTQNIVEVASSTTGFSTLVTALQAANVNSVLTGEGPFTVFAPTDAAFATLPAGTLDALLMPSNRDLLVKLLYNHVAYGDVTSDQLQVGMLDTFDGDVAIGITPNGVMVDRANVIQADVDASNGVIHAVDRVLVPAGFTEQLQARLTAPASTSAANSQVTDSATQVTRSESVQTTETEAEEPTSPTSQPAAAPAAPEQPVRGLW